MEGNVVEVWRTPGVFVFPFTFLIGPDWGCNLITYALTVVPSISFLVFAAPKIHFAVLIVGIVLFGVCLWLLAWTAQGDPGYLPRKSRAEFEEERAMLSEKGELDRYASCERCNIHRGPRVSHCYACDRCVWDLDHHCPWHGKCIAGRNIAPFYAYMWAIIIFIIFIGISLFVWITRAVATGKN